MSLQPRGEVKFPEYLNSAARFCFCSLARATHDSIGDFYPKPEESMRRTKKRTAVPVSMRALCQRVNRRLKVDGTVMKKSVGAQAREELGAYAVISGSGVVLEDVDPTALGREMGCLKPWEEVVE